MSVIKNIAWQQFKKIYGMFIQILIYRNCFWSQWLYAKCDLLIGTIKLQTIANLRL